MKAKYIIFLLILLFVPIISCQLFCGVVFDETTFEEEYQLWKENNFTDYSFICDRYIFEGAPFSGKVKISVHNETGSCELLDEDSRIDPEELKSINDIFEYIKDLKRELKNIAKTEKRGFYQFTISYDKTYHYPNYVEVHHNRWKRLDLAIPYTEKLEITDFTLTNTQ